MLRNPVGELQLRGGQGKPRSVSSLLPPSGPDAISCTCSPALLHPLEPPLGCPHPLESLHSLLQNVPPHFLHLRVPALSLFVSSLPIGQWWLWLPQCLPKDQSLIHNLTELEQCLALVETLKTGYHSVTLSSPEPSANEGRLS